MKHSLAHGAGYVIVDHRDSPGLTAADVATLPGTLAVAGGQVLEADAFTCSHCQRGILRNPGLKRETARCQKCYHYICHLCAGVLAQGGACVPAAKRCDVPSLLLTDAWR